MSRRPTHVSLADYFWYFWKMTKSKKVQVGNWGTAEGTNTFARLINCKQTNNPKFKRKNTELAEADSGWPYLEVSSANKSLWRSWTERWRKDPGTHVSLQCWYFFENSWYLLTFDWLVMKWHAGVDAGGWLLLLALKVLAELARPEISNPPYPSYHL